MFGGHIVKILNKLLKEPMADVIASDTAIVCHAA